MAKKKGEWNYFEGKLPKLPTVTPIDESIHILEETVAVLQLKIAELKAQRKPVLGKFEPVIHPRTGRVGRNGPSKRRKRVRGKTCQKK